MSFDRSWMIHRSWAVFALFGVLGSTFGLSAKEEEPEQMLEAGPLLSGPAFRSVGIPASFLIADTHLPAKPQENTCPEHIAKDPTRTPMSVPPRPLDPEGTKKAFANGLSWESGGSPSNVQVFLWFLIGKTGRVEDARISAGSGSPEIDSLAVVLAREIKFRPASLQGEPTCVWLRLRAPFPMKPGAFAAGNALPQRETPGMPSNRRARTGTPFFPRERWLFGSPPEELLVARSWSENEN